MKSQRSPLNRSTAPSVVRLFDYCFKQGVEDAYALEDDFAAKEWMEEHLKNDTYGVLSDKDLPFDWRRWRFTLYRWCRIARLPSLADTYLNRLERYRNTFAFSILHFAMRFYLMGVKEWLDYPNPANLAYFRQNNKVHWIPCENYLRKMRISDFVSYVQEFVYERKDAAIEGDTWVKRYDDFSQALWRCSQKYEVIGDSEEPEEDL